ncbi:uncharacterized protein LOC125704732 isoform X2 [Brienomyrus brachyistius]|uniref:uncharacterized protein LOC125704732 isoform X2 n=1 Tax=Brienomyrus brachyistius TaxID=42636 RepID=UPI0020B29BA7|nr:uncharacterized protein LOC125704732 isoform X2 [Brienomyrus brachyistius]
MASSKLRSRKLSPKQEAAYFISACKDKDGLYVKYINSYKGRGVYSRFHFERGDFLLEYRGQLISRHECESRQKIYHDALKVFMFEFYFNGKLFCIDAARDDGSLGRLVNDDHVSPNSKMKKITISGKPHLCLFATRSISPGEEITYNYGDSDWPWRCKVATEKDQLHPKEQSTSSENITDVGMTTNVQLLPEGQHADVLREETEEAVSEGDPCANTLMDTSSLNKEMEQNITDVGMTTNVQLLPEGQHADVLREETEEAVSEGDPCANTLMDTSSLSKEMEQNITDVGMTTNVQLLPEGQHADVLREETEEAVSEGDPCANTLMDNSSLSKEMEQNITDVGMTTNVQLLPEGQHADVLREETEEAVSEGDPCANTLMDNSSLSKEMEQNITDVGMTTNVQLLPEGQHADVLREETEEVATKLDFCKTGGHRSSFPNENVEKPCKHEVIHANFSSMDKCSACFGPVAPLKWIGLRCKVCSKFWHKNCFAKFEKNDEEPLSWMRST